MSGAGQQRHSFISVEAHDEVVSNRDAEILRLRAEILRLRATVSELRAEIGEYDAENRAMKATLRQGEPSSSGLVGVAAVIMLISVAWAVFMLAVIWKGGVR